MSRLKVSNIYEDTVKMVRLRLNKGWDYVWFTYNEEKGFISITSSFGNWSYIWSSMGKGEVLSTFFRDAGRDYLSNKLWGKDNDYFDLDEAIKEVKQDIINDRKLDSRPKKVAKAHARLLWKAIEEIGEDFDGCSRERFMSEFSDNNMLGPWNPDFWEANWGMRLKPGFLTLKNEIIPMIQSYFKGELREEVDTTPSQET